MPQITIFTTITAPISTAWECFTQPNHVKGWNFASPDWECPATINGLKDPKSLIDITTLNLTNQFEVAK
jgi:hypothetical protein